MQDDRTSAEYQQWRQDVRHRDGNACRRCGFNTNLEVHHIKPLVKYPEFLTELDNGLTLCGNCHSLLRGREETTDLLKFIEESPYSRDEQIIARLMVMMSEQLKALNDKFTELTHRKAEVPIGNDSFTEPGHIQAEILRLEAEEKLREAERLRREADDAVKQRRREAEQKRQREAKKQQQRKAEEKLRAAKRQTSLRDFQQDENENLSDKPASVEIKKRKNFRKPKNSHTKHLKQTNQARSRQRSNASGRWKVKTAQQRLTSTTSPKQDAAALKQLEFRAGEGNAKAQFSLGKRYRHSGNDRVAVRWYRKAAEQGNVAAQYNLGWMYEYGEGVLQDDAEAVKWYRKAAKQGDISAQNKLAKRH